MKKKVNLLPSYCAKGIYPFEKEFLEKQKRFTTEECLELTQELLFNIGNFSLSEFKPLMNIWLRTIGFKKQFEVIEYNDFLHGHKNTDNGSISSRGKLREALKSLLDRNIIGRRWVGKNQMAYWINFDVIKGLNKKYDKNRVPFKVGALGKINPETSFRLLWQFLAKDLKSIKASDLKVMMFTYASSVLWGGNCYMGYRQDYKKGYKAQYADKFYTLGLDICMKTIYKSLERLDEQREYFACLVEKKSKALTTVFIFIKDKFIRSFYVNQQKQHRQRKNGINYASYRRLKKNRQRQKFRVQPVQVDTFDFSKPNERYF